MTPRRITLGILFGTAAVPAWCAMALLFLCATSFAGGFLMEITPTLVGLESTAEVWQLFDSICMSLPYSLQEILPAGV